MLIQFGENSNYVCTITTLTNPNYASVSGNNKPFLEIESESSKVTSTIWGPLDKTIITGHDDGTITQWDMTVTKYLLVICDRSCGIFQLENFFLRLVNRLEV